MFLKFALEGFADRALDEGLEVFITKILIYQASTEAWGHRMGRNNQAVKLCLAITVQ